MSSVPPQYITIGRAAEYFQTTDCIVPHPAEPIPVEVLPFQDYVRNVLPNEWIASWPAASLDAGAIAAKQFAWYTAFVEGKWSGQGYRFDLLDNTCDQVYRPGRATEATDAAVMRTWLASLTRDGRLFPTYYRAYERQCPFVPGCMGQHESARMAEQGWSAQQILQYYYYPADYNVVRLDPRAYIPLTTR
jgi:peptidoglycan hydrolase-like amidase